MSTVMIVAACGSTTAADTVSVDRLAAVDETTSTTVDRNGPLQRSGRGDLSSVPLSIPGRVALGATDGGLELTKGPGQWVRRRREWA